MTHVKDVPHPAVDRLVRPREAAYILGVARTTFYELIKSGALPPPIKQGRCAFLLESDLRAYVAGLTATRTAA